MSVNSKLIKNAFAFMCVAVLSVAMLCGCSSQSSSSSSSSASSSAEATANEPAAEENVVSLVIVDPDSEGVNIFDQQVALEVGDTVYSVVVNSAVPADIQDGQFGKYIVSINDIAAEGSSGWVYTINGEEVMESIDNATVNPGDVIEFTYTTF